MQFCKLIHQHIVKSGAGVHSSKLGRTLMTKASLLKEKQHLGLPFKLRVYHFLIILFEDLWKNLFGLENAGEEIL